MITVSMKCQIAVGMGLTLLVGAGLPVARAQEPAKPTFGHSMKGDAFNEGPRQKAVLMSGIPKLSFPVTTRSPMAQRFVEQGVAQLHAYWYFEAERSFRQAAALDPDCAMAYWGMARANINNRERAKAFCREAWKRRERVTPRERAYIEAWAIWSGADPARPSDDKKRGEDHIAALRRLSEAHPSDIEARAFLAHALLEDPKGGKRLRETEALLQQVLARNPMHPAHHYRIHLWDGRGNDRALDSARRSGPAIPASAHMWHMAGHTYSGLKRYADAAEAQEASARTDHAYMRRTGILPDQIFNYAHNNQWLVESLQFTGRASDAVAVARSLIANPRHPKYNTLEKNDGSAASGTRRLLETLERYELWNEALRLWKAGDIEAAPARADRERDRLRLLGSAAYATGDIRAGKTFLDELAALADKQNKDRRAPYDRALAAIRCYAALGQNDGEEAKKQLEAAGLPEERRALLLLRLGETARAIESAREGVKARPGQVLPLAALVRALDAGGQTEAAKAEFAALRRRAPRADLDTPLLAALAPIAQRFGLPRDWRLAPPDAARPSLPSLGPLTFEAPVHRPLSLRDAGNRKVDLAAYRGRNVLVLFFLGAACERCMSQLNAFADQRAAFAKLGIELLAVSTEAPEGVRAMTSVRPGVTTTASPAAARKYDFPILADPTLAAFKAWGAYDDFEGMALHGAFLVDASGKVRWQDTGFEPFMKADFVLAESRRLLKPAPADVAAPRPAAPPEGVAVTALPPR